MSNQQLRSNSTCKSISMSKESEISGEMLEWEREIRERKREGKEEKRDIAIWQLESIIIMSISQFLVQRSPNGSRKELSPLWVYITSLFLSFPLSLICSTRHDTWSFVCDASSHHASPVIWQMSNQQPRSKSTCESISTSRMRERSRERDREEER
jgi:hypothetical protein